MSAVRHLRALTDAGEVVDNPDVSALEEELAKLRVDRQMAERELRAKRRRISELERDKARERDEYPRRDEIERIHRFWNRLLRQDKALTADRFDAVRGILDEQKIEVVDGRPRKVDAYGPVEFEKAIRGARFDPYVKRRRNGTEHRHDDLALIFRDGKSFESFIARAP